MSTEHQQYSIDNQKAAIEEYAQQHHLEIIDTYVDAGKSGLDLAHRPGLRALLEDITCGRAEFSAVLVFDVSRWGRFQDSDEAAHYEFLCKEAGIRVHYCTEPFPNDASLSSALFKTLKRAMAAEYSRELSGKVFAGQCRIARNGFKLGGPAGYGLRRVLLDSHNCPKLVLKAGERKSLITEKVSYVLGPDEEVRVVREIYSMFLDQKLTVNAIMRRLHSRHSARGIPGPWRRGVVQTILTHPKYAGCIVFNRTSVRLRSKRVFNPREQWIVQPTCFPAIVSADTFERAQARLARSVVRRTNLELLADLRVVANTYGKLTIGLITDFPDIASWATYRKRFGSVRRAFDLALNRPAGQPRSPMPDA
jgi:DNA invertase Pin-like site-specific DNA recombinase